MRNLFALLGVTASFFFLASSCDPKTHGLTPLISLAQPKVTSRYKNVGDIVVDFPEYCPLCSHSPEFFYVNGNRIFRATKVPKSLVPHFLEEYFQKVKIDSRTCVPDCKSLPVYLDLDDDEEMISIANPEYAKFFSRFGDPFPEKNSNSASDFQPNFSEKSTLDGLWNVLIVIGCVLLLIVSLWTAVNKAEAIRTCISNILSRPVSNPTRMNDNIQTGRSPTYQDPTYESVV